MVPRIRTSLASLVCALVLGALAVAALAPATTAEARMLEEVVYADEEKGLDLRPSVPSESDGTVSAMAVDHPVIALDPGHGYWDSGAVGRVTGIEEKDVNWRIYEYTRERLIQLGVPAQDIFVTHEKDECTYQQNSNGSWGYNTPTIKERVDRAIAAGACIFVSQHINDWSDPSLSGFDLYVPRESSFYPSVRDEGVAFAQALAPKLKALGLRACGVDGLDTRLCDYLYPNGDKADYYGITRYARYVGLPGILVEHAFISSTYDEPRLNDDNFLRQLGYADAEAIYERLDALYDHYCRIQGIPNLYKKDFSEIEGQIDDAPTGSVFRLYNPYTFEHLYTTDRNEAKTLLPYGWNYEDVEWVDPGTGDEVLRLYNPNTDEHLYSVDPAECEGLCEIGWRNEGAKLHSAPAEAPGSVAVYRLYNGYTDRHLFTSQPNEYEQCQEDGWTGEGAQFYGLDPDAIQAGTGTAPDVDATPVRTARNATAGASRSSREALRAWFASKMASHGKAYPALYASLGAPTVEDYVDIIFDEAEDEGVRADVMLAQEIYETGWLSFTGDVDVSQCNFCGLGATGNGEPGCSFPDVRTGIRAHAQHLHLYADANLTEDDLAHPLVDPRFRGNPYQGIAPTLEGLSGHWGIKPDYHEYLLEMIDTFPNDLA